MVSFFQRRREFESARDKMRIGALRAIGATGALCSVSPTFRGGERDVRLSAEYPKPEHTHLPQPHKCGNHVHINVTVHLKSRPDKKCRIVNRWWLLWQLAAAGV